MTLKKLLSAVASSTVIATIAFAPVTFAQNADDAASAGNNVEQSVKKEANKVSHAAHGRKHHRGHHGRRHLNANKEEKKLDDAESTTKDAANNEINNAKSEAQKF